MRRSASLPRRLAAWTSTALLLNPALVVPARAAPQGEEVVRGDVRFERVGDLTTITASDLSIIRYHGGFDIGVSETVEFVQPSADSRVLNQILTDLPTRVDGTLLANGQVYLVNRNGIVVGPQGRVDTGSFVASIVKAAISSGFFSTRL